MKAVILLDGDIHLRIYKIVSGQGVRNTRFQLVNCQALGLHRTNKGCINHALGGDRKISLMLLFTTCIYCQGKDVARANVIRPVLSNRQERECLKNKENHKPGSYDFQKRIYHHRAPNIVDCPFLLTL